MELNKEDENELKKREEGLNKLVEVTLNTKDKSEEERREAIRQMLRQNKQNQSGSL